MNPNQPLMSISELGEYLKVPVATLHQWHTKKKGPRTLKVGRHLRYRIEDVEDWLRQQASHDHD